LPYAALIPLDQRVELNSDRGMLALKGSGAGFWGDDIVASIAKYRDEWK